jgi:hypothetical protein
MSNIKANANNINNINNINKRQSALYRWISECYEKGEPVVIESIVNGTLSVPSEAIARSAPFRLLAHDIERLVELGYIYNSGGELNCRA